MQVENNLLLKSSVASSRTQVCCVVLSVRLISENKLPRVFTREILILLLE